MIYAESDLIAPTLRILAEKEEGASTEELIRILTEQLQPTGKDAEILAERNDTHFSQKVRNLKSHDTLTRKGLATYEDGTYKITDQGRRYLAEDYSDIAEALRDQGFGEEERNREFVKDYEGLIIEEGASFTHNVNKRNRSRHLAEIAKEHFRNDKGQIPCMVCEFDFLDFYGELGKSYIEIHHLKPIHEYEISGEKGTVETSLKNLAPLCSNCHRMVHRKKGELISPENLKDIIGGRSRSL